jgi:nucleotide-binding universal stress UspA family protein
MIKDLVVNLSLAGKTDVAAEFAASVAGTLDAHVMGVSFFYEPVFPAVDVGAIPADLIDEQVEENERKSANARNRFEELARRNALSAETRELRATLDGSPDVFARIARRFDLSVVSQPRPDTANTDALFVEAALFNSGRPALIVPYIQRSGVKLDRVMVCWDGSRAAARATADALPFLSRSKATEIVTVTNGKSDIDEIPGADIAQHLARHGINVELKQLVAGRVDIANVLLSHAADSSADLIVMGGYGHSRFREFVLGGATRGLLAAMTVPTLMSH